MKKGIAISTLSLLLSSGFVSVSAKDNGNNTVKTVYNVKQTVMLGGGPSPSAAWTKKKSYYQNFTHAQLNSLNKMYSNTVNSSSYARKKYIYDISCFVASAAFGKVSGIAGLASSALFTFSSTYFSLIQKTANVVNQAYYKGGTRALYVTQYYRPASGETIVCLSWY